MIKKLKELIKGDDYFYHSAIAVVEGVTVTDGLQLAPFTVVTTVNNNGTIEFVREEMSHRVKVRKL